MVDKLLIHDSRYDTLIMKKILVFCTFVFLLTWNSDAQVLFKKGYFIDNNGQKTDCLIKDNDRRNNPFKFEFKLSEKSASTLKTIEESKEFGIYNFLKYVRANVSIGRSASRNNLSTDEELVFKEEVLFLKVLVEGKSSLYQYSEKGVVTYFYHVDNSDGIEQLVFKEYMSSENKIRENSKFREQLFSELKCESISLENVLKVEYSKDDLVDYFKKYNECKGSEFIVFGEKEKKDLFNLNLRLGLNSSSMRISSEQNSSRDVNFGSEIGFRLGIETEFVLPFNNNKWSVIVEPTFQYFKSEKETGLYDVEVDYKSVEIPIGIRYYFFLNDNSKIFINGSVVLDIVGDSKISYSGGTDLEISNSTNLGFGFGFKSYEKYSIELRYHTSRDLLGNYLSYESDYKTASLILGYTLF